MEIGGKDTQRAPTDSRHNDLQATHRRMIERVRGLVGSESGFTSHWQFLKNGG